MWSQPFVSALGLVSALALRARADTSPSGWDTGWDHIYHVIFYMYHIPSAVFALRTLFYYCVEQALAVLPVSQTRAETGADTQEVLLYFSAI